jgi:hypothetical protein
MTKREDDEEPKQDEAQEDEAPKLPAVIARLAQNLRAAAATTGSGAGGVLFMRVDDRAGTVTAGPSRDPVPLEDRYVVGLHTFSHGYLVFGHEAGVQRVMVPMVEQPVRPVPPTGYAARFGEPGAKNATEIKLTSLSVIKYELAFTAMGISNENRLRSLLEDALAHFATEEGRRGFIHPVILIRPGHYFHQAQGREIWHFDYVIADGMNDAGGLASKQGGAGGPGPGGPGDQAAEPAPWDVEPEAA